MSKEVHILGTPGNGLSYTSVPEWFLGSNIPYNVFYRYVVIRRRQKSVLGKVLKTLVLRWIYLFSRSSILVEEIFRMSSSENAQNVKRILYPLPQKLQLPLGIAFYTTQEVVFLAGEPIQRRVLARFTSAVPRKHLSTSDHMSQNEMFPAPLIRRPENLSVWRISATVGVRNHKRRRLLPAIVQSLKQLIVANFGFLHQTPWPTLPIAPCSLTPQATSTATAHHTRPSPYELFVQCILSEHWIA